MAQEKMLIAINFTGILRSNTSIILSEHHLFRGTIRSVILFSNSQCRLGPACRGEEDIWSGDTKWVVFNLLKTVEFKKKCAVNWEQEISHLLGGVTIRILLWKDKFKTIWWEWAREMCNVDGLLEYLNFSHYGHLYCQWLLVTIPFTIYLYCLC